MNINKFLSTAGTKHTPSTSGKGVNGSGYSWGISHPSYRKCRPSNWRFFVCFASSHAIIHAQIVDSICYRLSHDGRDMLDDNWIDRMEAAVAMWSICITTRDEAAHHKNFPYGRVNEQCWCLDAKEILKMPEVLGMDGESRAAKKYKKSVNSVVPHTISISRSRIDCVCQLSNEICTSIDDDFFHAGSFRWGGKLVCRCPFGSYKICLNALVEDVSYRNSSNHQFWNGSRSHSLTRSLCVCVCRYEC